MTVRELKCLTLQLLYSRVQSGRVVSQTLVLLRHIYREQRIKGHCSGEEITAVVTVNLQRKESFPVRVGLGNALLLPHVLLQ